MRKIIKTAAVLLMPMAMFAQTDRIQCTDSTRNNTQCKNVAVIGRNICWQHDSTYVKPVALDAVVCSGATKAGDACKNKTKHVSGTCYHHRLNTKSNG